MPDHHDHASPLHAHFVPPPLLALIDSISSATSSSSSSSSLCLHLLSSSDNAHLRLDRVARAYSLCLRRLAAHCHALDRQLLYWSTTSPYFYALSVLPVLLSSGIGLNLHLNRLLPVIPASSALHWPRQECSARATLVSAERNKVARQLGILHSAASSLSLHDSSVEDIVVHLLDAMTRAFDNVSNDAADAEITFAACAATRNLEFHTGAPPPPYLRLWAPTVALGLATATLVPSVARLRAIIVHATYTVIPNIVSTWLIAPLTRVYRTVRYNESVLYGSSHCSATNAEDAIAAELRARDDMIASYVGSVPECGMDVVMADYAREARSPLRAIVAGNLIRLILIQAQCAKVDIEQALAALDKLMRTNELNFALLAFLPSFVLAAYAASRVQAWLLNRGFSSARRARQTAKLLVWRLERSYEDSKLDAETRLGLMLLETFTFRKNLDTLRLHRAWHDAVEADIMALIECNSDNLDGQSSRPLRILARLQNSLQCAMARG